LRNWEAVREWLFLAISASGSDFNPQNTQCIPAVKIFVFLDLAKNLSFSDSLLGAVIPWPDLDICGQKDYNAIIYFIDGGHLCN